MKDKKRQIPVGDGFDLQHVNLTDVGGITIDDEDDLTVTVQVPVIGRRGELTGHAPYEETIRLSTAPGYVQQAVRELGGAVLRALRERAVDPPESQCSTCIGMCCGVSPESELVQVTAEDVERLEAAKIDVHKSITFYEQPTWRGHVGELDKAEVEIGGETWSGCVFLRPNGCSIYEHRPLICREYVAWSCDLHVEDPHKVDGKVRLRVLTPHQ